MHTFLLRFFKLVMVGCFVAAVCEVNWVLILAVFATAFTGLLCVGMSQGASDNHEYEAAVLEYRLSEESMERLPLFHPVWSLLFLAAFAALAGTAIWLDNPWWVFVPFSVTLVLGVTAAFRRRTQRSAVWRDFADGNGLRFHAGNLWNRHDSTSVSGHYSGRELGLTTAWQTNLHNRSSSEVFIGTVPTTTADEDFCVDQLAVAQSRSDIVKSLFEQQDLARRLSAAQLKRISLFEGEVSIHAPRVPQTVMELRFYCELLKDLAGEVESIVRARPESQ